MDSSASQVPQYRFKTDISNAIQTQAETSSYDKVAGFKYYLAYRDNAVSNRGTVYAYYDLSNAWETVGPQGFTSLSVENFKMVVDNSNNIYVAYKNVSGHLALQKYSSATWSANLLSTNYLTGELDMGVDINNDIFIAFQDLVSDSSNTKLSVLKYDVDVSTFSFIGGQRFTAGNTRQPTIEIDRDGLVIVGFREANIIDIDTESLLRPTVMKYIGSLWTVIDERGFTKETIASNTSRQSLTTSITTDFNKDIFFGYTNFQNDQKAQIVRSVARKLRNICNYP